MKKRNFFHWHLVPAVCQTTVDTEGGPRFVREETRSSSTFSRELARPHADCIPAAVTERPACARHPKRFERAPRFPKALPEPLLPPK